MKIPEASRFYIDYAFGFRGAGFQIGPGVGDVMAELIATQTTTPIDVFDIGRLATAA